MGSFPFVPQKRSAAPSYRARAITKQIIMLKHNMHPVRSGHKDPNILLPITTGKEKFLKLITQLLVQRFDVAPDVGNWSERKKG